MFFLYTETIIAVLAHLVEQLPRNEQVFGSSPENGLNLITNKYVRNIFLLWNESEPNTGVNAGKSDEGAFSEKSQWTGTAVNGGAQKEQTGCL